MVTKTCLPSNLCDNSDSSDSIESCDSSDSSDSSDSCDSSDQTNFVRKKFFTKNFFFLQKKIPENLFKKKLNCDETQKFKV